MKRKMMSVCLLILLLPVFSLTAMAQQIDYSKNGSISVTMVSPDGMHPMAGAEFSVYYVAAAATDADGKLTYIFTDDFNDFGLSVYDPNLLTRLNVLVSEKMIPFSKMTTDMQGKAHCNNFPPGLYLVKQTGKADGFALCSPFLVALPTNGEGGYIYDVDASPKTDVIKLIDIQIKKVWNEDKSTVTPNNVQVQLLHDGEILETATLSEQNHWRVTYMDFPESDRYSIKEVNVPKGFTATYSQKGYEFTVTNTASLAQTGQLIWPIPVLAVAGLIFLLMGFVILQKSGKYNA